MVPEGWISGKAGDLIESLDAGVSVNSEDNGDLLSEYKILKTSCVSNGYFDLKECKSVTERSEQTRLKEHLRADSIIISRMNTPALVGANAYVESERKNVFLPDRLWQAKPKTNSVMMKWLAYWFSSQHTRYTLSQLGTGTSGSMKNITKSDVLAMKINIPPLPEQQKIARILSTWDKAIEVTEELLNNSQQQKKSLMQQLLDNPEWPEVRLNSVVEISTGKSKSKFVNDNGKNFVIDMGSVSRDGKLIPSKRTDVNEDYLSQGQLVMPKDDIGGGNIIGRVGFIDKEQQYILSDHVYALTVNGCDSLFLSYLINHTTVNRSLRRKANGTAQLGLGKKDVEKQLVRIPERVEEQKKVASILLTADQEIGALEKKIERLKQEKKALMQQLLTGKRRVVVDEEREDKQCLYSA